MKAKFITCGLIVGGVVLALSARSQTPEMQSASMQSKVTQNATFLSDVKRPETKPPDEKYSSLWGSHLEPILKEINASPKQRTSITTIMDEFKPQMEPMRKKYRDLREEFLKAMASGGSAEQLMNTQLEMSRLQTEISTNYLMMRLKIRKVLSSEQVVKFEEYRKRQGWKSAS